MAVLAKHILYSSDYPVGSPVPVTVEKMFLILTTTPGGAQANPAFSKLSFATSKSKTRNLTAKAIFGFLKSTPVETLKSEKPWV